METREKRFKNSHSHEIVESNNSDNPVNIQKLNDDCLTSIFMNLQIVDRIRIERVCKRWRDVSKKSWQNVKTLHKSAAIWGFELQDMLASKKMHILKNILSRCGLFLRHLDFSSITINSIILYTVGKFCPNLQFLDLGSIKLTLPTIKTLTKNCHNLIEFTFGNCTKACKDSQLSELFSQNKQLQSLKIINNVILTGECLTSLPVNMDIIIIKGCRSMSFSHISNALEQFGHLKTFSLTNPGGIQIFNRNIHSIPTTLRILEIPGCAIFDVDSIVQMKNLEKLIFSGVDLVTDAFLVALTANCKQLNHLNINECTKVTNVGLQAVTRLPKLKHLSLAYLNKITDRSLTFVSDIQELICAGCENVKDDGLCRLIETCNSIEILDLSFCIQITNTFVQHAIQVTKQRTNNLVLNLGLVGTSVDPAELNDKSPLLKMTLPFSFDSSTDSELSFFGHIVPFMALLHHRMIMADFSDDDNDNYYMGDDDDDDNYYSDHDDDNYYNDHNVYDSEDSEDDFNIKSGSDDLLNEEDVEDQRIIDSDENGV